MYLEILKFNLVNHSIVPISNKIKDFKVKALNSRLIADSFWAIFGNIIGKGLALGAGIIIARFLGKDIYGEFGIIRSTLMSIAIFSTFGLGYTATKFVAEFKNHKPEYLHQILSISKKTTIVVSGLMAIFLFLGATFIAEKILEAPHLVYPLKLTSIWIIFNAFSTLQIGILAGFGDFRGIAIVNTVTGITTFILSIIFTFNWQLLGALCALILAQILNWYLNYRLVKKNLSKIPNVSKKKEFLLKEILNFSLPVALQEALFSITAWLMSLLLIKLSTYGQLGLYYVAVQWSAIILFVPGVMRNVILSHLSESTNNETRNKRVFKITIMINFSLTFIPFLIVFLFSEYIQDLYGSTFEGLNYLINIAVLGTVFNSLDNVYSQAYIAKGKSWFVFSIRLVRAFGVLFITYFFLRFSSNYPGSVILSYSQLAMAILFLIVTAYFYHFRHNISPIS